MNLKAFRKTDRRILITALILLLLSTCLLLNDSWIYRIVQTKDLNLTKLGEVTKAEKDVRRRFEIALSWLPLHSTEEVYQGDSVFTGADSSAVIRTTDGEEIFIAPNSLVVLNQRKDSISIDIGFGSVEGRVGKGKRLLITSNNNLTELVGDKAVVKVDAGEGNNLVVNVIAGEVKVKSADGEKTIRQNEITELAADGTLRDLSGIVTLLSPANDQRFKAVDDKPVLFKWKSARKFNRTKIKIGADPEFKRTLVDARVTDDQYSGYGLPSDTELYWQILTEGGQSKIGLFVVVGDRPPIPIFPKPGQQIYFDPYLQGPDAAAAIDLSWEEGSPATAFEVQLSRDLLFQQVIKSWKTRHRTVSAGKIPAGDYYWRIRSLDFPNERWSEHSMFRVGPEPSKLLAPPVPEVSSAPLLLVTKVHGKSAQDIRNFRGPKAYGLIENPPTLKWSRVSGAERYQVEISRNRKFTDLAVKSVTSENYFTWLKAEPGTYYWRIKGLSENFKDGNYTNSQTLRLSMAPPQNIGQSVIIDEVPDPVLLEAPPPPLDLKWNATIFTHAYEVEVAPRSDFKNATRFITEAASRKIQLNKPGVYYWRVRSLDQKNLPLSPYSVAYSLDFQRVYKDPKAIKNLMALYPRQQDSIILVGRNKSELEFQWTKPFDDAIYRLELSYSPDFQEVFFTTETKNNFYKFTEPFRGRIVYWRVRAQTAEFFSEWTGANRFLISYENKPFEFELSDQLFVARMMAQERQKELLAAQRRRLNQLRSIASVDMQLDQPQLQDPVSFWRIDSNYDPKLTARDLASQNFERFYTQVRNYPTIRWKKVTAAERYVLEIARDPQFKQTVVKAPCWNNYFSWDTVRPGQFYYRVQAFNDRYMRSPFSAPQPLHVEVESPVPTSTDQFVDIYNEPREMWPAPSPFVLSWRPVVFARGYEVEFSEDPKFALTKVFRTQDSSHEFQVSKTGLYYWRVRPINEHGVAVGSFSSVRSVEVIQTHRGPASVGTLTGLFPMDRILIFVGKGKPNIPFHWTAPDPDREYEIEISQTADFSNIIRTLTANGTKLVVNSELPEGNIYWRVRGRKGVTPAYQFQLRRETEPYASSRPENSPK